MENGVVAPTCAAACDWPRLLQVRSAHGPIGCAITLRGRGSDRCMAAAKPTGAIAPSQPPAPSKGSKKGLRGPTLAGPDDDQIQGGRVGVEGSSQFCSAINWSYLSQYGRLAAPLGTDLSSSALSPPVARATSLCHLHQIPIT